MADISKIITPDGTTYNIKDSTARSQSGVTGVKGNAESSYRTGNVNLTAANVGAVAKTDELQTTNPFAPNSTKGPYISKIDNAFYAADKRWTITATNTSSPVSVLFDGSYESHLRVNDGKTSVITFDFSNTTYFPGYPYGYILISFYHVAKPSSISGRVYCNYSQHGVGWHDISFSALADSGTSNIVYKSSHQGYYQISQLEITIVGDTTNSYGYTGVTQIEMHLDRPDPSKNPFLSKYNAETLYYNLTAPKFIGALEGNADTATNASKVNNHTVGKDVPSDAVFTDTTYESKAAASGGTAVSLVTTGEKYTWNNKSTVPTNHASSATTYGTGSSGNYGHVKLSASTSSTSAESGGIAATPSAVKTAYDLADTANDTANTALSGVNGNLIYDHTFTISNGVATFTPHVYQAGSEVTTNYAKSCFTWKYRLIDGSEVSLTTKSDRGCDVTITNLGYGGHVIGIFTPPA